jgi:alpha-L-arabinofuranosidase
MPRSIQVFTLSVVVAATFFALLGLSMGLPFVGGHAPTARASAADLVVYDDALASGWQNWSWGSTVNFANATLAHGGAASISVKYNQAWAGLSLRASNPLDASLYTAITFWVHGGESAGARSLSFYVQQTDSGTESAQIDFSAPAGVWTQFTMTLSALGNPGAIARLNIQDRSGASQPTFYVDDILIIGAAAPPAMNGVIRIQTGGVITPVDPRILGTNLPTWLNSTNFANAVFRARTAASGVTVIRMPGGSWSNSYGWLSCELRSNVVGALPCGDNWQSWTARPTDFINFLKATGKQGMWVVSPNGASKEAAALVAFFNATTTDSTNIGVDIQGTNWYTAGHWAQLRAAHGNPQPVGVQLWAVGNEVYGGKPSSGGAQCQVYGWEDVWTCDGVEYVNGIVGHEGYAAFRDAMRAVDPTIWVGAVGLPESNSYNNWGNEVIAAAGVFMDFYDIHQYAYFNPPASYAEALAQPQSAWRAIRADLNNAFNANAGGRQIPVGVTEYNLFSVQDQDDGQLMTRAVNALFLADAIGQMVQHGFVMGNQWDLANGRAGNGTEYGLMHVDNNWARSPQYYVFPLWARFGSQMLSTESSFNAATQLSVYGGRVDANTVSLLAINKAGSPITAEITVENGNDALEVVGGSSDIVQAASLDAQTVTYNNVSNPADDLSDAPALPLNSSGGTVTYVFAANSVTLLRLQTGANPPTETPTPTPTFTPTPTSTPTNTPTPTKTPTTARIIIALDAQPESKQDFRFSGGLGSFRLDDANPNDGDAYSQSRAFTVAPGAYSVTESIPSTWRLTAILCTPSANGVVDLARARVTLNVAGGDDVNCTFVNLRDAAIQTRVYHDLNVNGARNSGEAYLSGWTITVYNDQGQSAGAQTTNKYGKANFNYLLPGQYIVCETLMAAWSNSQPGVLDANFGQPCYAFTAGPGQTVTLWYGNYLQSAAALGQPSARTAMAILDGPDVATDDAGYDGWVFVDEDLNRPELELDLEIFLPLVRR